MHSDPSLLLVDCTTPVLRLGLYHAGVLHIRIHDNSPHHGAVVLELIQQLNDESGIGIGELDYLCWNCGPGSFTGIRMALSIMQALSLTGNYRVISLSSLELLACQAHRSFGYERWLCLIDARMNRVYTGTFDVSSSSILAVTGEMIVALDDLQFIGNDIHVASTGMKSVYDQLPAGIFCRQALDLNIELDTMLLLALRYVRQGRVTDISQVKPAYLYDYATT